MTDTLSLLARVCDAQTRNRTLGGRELREAGLDLAGLATRKNHAVLAVDDAGERLIGAALLMDDRVRTVDMSHRLDGQSVMLVAGYIAGTAGIAVKAALVRSFGAGRVEAALLGSTTSFIEGCEDVSLLAPSRHLVAL